MKYIKLFELYEKPEKQIYDHIKVLKEFVKKLKNKKSEGFDFVKKYFTIIHNFLILQIGFNDDIQEGPFNEFALKIYDINSSLIHHNLINGNIKTVDEINSKFEEMYDPNDLTRNCVEKFNGFTTIKEYLKDKPFFYNKLLNVNSTLKDIKLYRETKKYNL